MGSAPRRRRRGGARRDARRPGASHPAGRSTLGARRPASAAQHRARRSARRAGQRRRPGARRRAPERRPAPRPARQPRRNIVRGASLVELASGGALALDGELLNGAELRGELVSRGYSFAGESDAEVLLHAYQYWDKEVVKHLRGAFAFALWDLRKDRLLLARDRFGQKPLYIAERAGTVYFASEMKVLSRVPGVLDKVDLDAVGDVQ